MDFESGGKRFEGFRVLGFRVIRMFFDAGCFLFEFALILPLLCFALGLFLVRWFGVSRNL